MMTQVHGWGTSATRGSVCHEDTWAMKEHKRARWGAKETRGAKETTPKGGKEEAVSQIGQGSKETIKDY